MRKINPYIFGIIIYLALILIAVLLFCLAYEAPNFEGFISNLSTIFSGYYFAVTLIVFSICTVALMFFLKSDKKATFYIFLGLILISLSLGIAKEKFYRARLAAFFGDYKNGKIVFGCDYNWSDRTCKGAYILNLSNLKTNRYPSKKYNQLLDRYFADKSERNYSPNGKYLIGYDEKKLRHYLVDKNTNKEIFRLKHWLIYSAAIHWSPDSKFIVYDYAYDQDDLDKIFVANIETKETILLAAGLSPLWVE